MQQELFATISHDLMVIETCNWNANAKWLELTRNNVAVAAYDHI